MSIYGAFIYAEEIKAAMSHRDISTMTGGNFVMKSILDPEKNPLLQIKIELASNTEPNKTIEKKFAAVINNALEEQNPDYKALREAMPGRVLLQVVLLNYQDPELSVPGRIKHQYTER
ncbi:MAG: hypothetical protein GY950_24030 [bacterium]|nr:hypothetical protein [bacterium]